MANLAINLNFQTGRRWTSDSSSCSSHQNTLICRASCRSRRFRRNRRVKGKAQPRGMSLCQKSGMRYWSWFCRSEPKSNESGCIPFFANFYFNFDLRHPTAHTSSLPRLSIYYHLDFSFHTSPFLVCCLSTLPILCRTSHLFLLTSTSIVIASPHPTFRSPSMCSLRPVFLPRTLAICAFCLRPYYCF